MLAASSTSSAGSSSSARRQPKPPDRPLARSRQPFAGPPCSAAVPPYVQAVPIRFRDIDALDHVNHAVILTFAETVRCDWFQKATGVVSMARLPFILAAAHIEYKAPIPKSAELEVEMCATRFGTKSWDFSYTVREARSKAVFATVTTVQVAYDYQRGQSIPIPADLRALLEGLH